MKTRIAASMFVVVLLALGMAVTASGQDLPSLSINPLAVSLQPETNQYFLATFSDGSGVASCNWTATGVGQNGVTLTTLEKNWAVFDDGKKAGVNYVISANCKSTKGISGSAHAYVFVK